MLISIIDYGNSGVKPKSLGLGYKPANPFVSQEKLDFCYKMWYALYVIRIGKQSRTLCPCPIQPNCLGRNDE